MPRRGLRPLHLEVLGGHHDGDLLDRALAEEFGRHPQRERRLAGPGVATARKSRGWPARYLTSALRCQPRSTAVPLSSPWSVSVRAWMLLAGIDTGPQSLLFDTASSVEWRL